MIRRHLQAPVQQTPLLDERPLGSVAIWLESKLATTSGAVAAGTANVDVLNSLVDGTASFTTTIAAGFIVHNTDDDIFAKVVSITNNSTVVLDYDAFPNGTEAYSIYRNPAIPEGWARMDGQSLSDSSSRFNGRVIDDWNSQDFITKKYDTGWVANSDWTNAEFAITHNLVSPLSELSVKFFISTDGTDTNSFEIVDADFDSNAATASSNGIVIYQTGTNSLKIQTGAQGISLVQDSGTITFIDTEAWYYKVVVYKPSKYGTSENESVQLLFKHKEASFATVGDLQVNDLTITGSINGSPSIARIDNDYTASVVERIIYSNPINNDIDITIPSDYPPGLSLKVVNNYSGYGMVINGDGESATSPTFTGGGAISLSNATWAQDLTDSFKGDASYRLTITTGGSEGYIDLTGTNVTTDLRGFVAGETYTIQAAVKPITISNPGEINLRFYYYHNGGWRVESSTASISSDWQILSITKTIPSAATGAIVRIAISSTASSGEYILVDEIRAWRNYYTRIVPAAGTLVGNGTYLGMNNQAAKAEISKSDNNGDFTIEQFSGLSGNVRLSSSPLTVYHNFGSSNYIVDVSPVSNEAGFLGEFGVFNFTPTTFQIYYTGSSDTVDMAWHLRPI